MSVLHIEVGLRLWRVREDSAMGMLLTLGGIFWLADGLGQALWPGLFVDSLMLCVLYQPVLLHCSLIIPAGRLAGRTAKLTVVAGYLFWPALALLQWLALPAPEVPGLLALRAIGYPLVGAGMLAFFTVRYLRTAADQRRALVPFWLANIVNIGATMILSTTSYLPDTWPHVAYYVAVALVPIGAAFSVARGHPLPTAVRRLVNELGRAESDPIDLRDSLRRGLDDPTLEVLTCDPPSSRLRDVVTGEPVDLGRLTGRRRATPLHHGDRMVGALVHGSAVAAKPEVLRAVHRTAALVLDNQRLLTEVQRQLHEVHESRRRLVEAADAERRRIERNVHDGVQQRMIAAALLLRRAEREGADVIPFEIRRLIRQGATEIDTTVGELREIVRGMSPAVLVRHGLVGAVESIAERSRVIIDIDDHLGTGELPEDTALAAYYVILEAVTNAEKHAGAQTVTVTLTDSDGRLAISIRDDGTGAARFVDGGGLIGIRDRVEACGGALRLDGRPGCGTTVLAHLPLSPIHRGQERAA